MTDNNRRQADIPEGATPIPEMPGTAPGLVCPIGDKVIYAVPGVPYEMREMMLGTILPDLRRAQRRERGHQQPRAADLGHERIGPGRDARAGASTSSTRTGNPTIAFQASGIEGIKVRITAKAADEAAAERLIAARRPRSALCWAISSSRPTTRPWKASCSPNSPGAAGPWPWPKA